MQTIIFSCIINLNATKTLFHLCLHKHVTFNDRGRNRFSRLQSYRRFLAVCDRLMNKSFADTAAATRKAYDVKFDAASDTRRLLTPCRFTRLANANFRPRSQSTLDVHKRARACCEQPQFSSIMVSAIVAFLALAVLAKSQQGEASGSQPSGSQPRGQVTRRQVLA